MNQSNNNGLGPREGQARFRSDADIVAGWFRRYIAPLRIASFTFPGT